MSIEGGEAFEVFVAVTRREWDVGTLNQECESVLVEKTLTHSQNLSSVELQHRHELSTHSHISLKSNLHLTASINDGCGSHESNASSNRLTANLNRNSIRKIPSFLTTCRSLTSSSTSQTQSAVLDHSEARNLRLIKILIQKALTIVVLDESVPQHSINIFTFTQNLAIICLSLFFIARLCPIMLINAAARI
jgi:hypothetical protein